MENLIQNLENTWKENGYSDEKIAEAVKMIQEETEDDSQWVKIPDLKFLECVKDYTHPSWAEIFNDKVHLATVEDDITGGVTFALYQKQGLLCWER